VRFIEQGQRLLRQHGRRDRIALQLAQVGFLGHQLAEGLRDARMAESIGQHRRREELQEAPVDAEQLAVGRFRGPQRVAVVPLAPQAQDARQQQRRLLHQAQDVVPLDVAAHGWSLMHLAGLALEIALVRAPLRSRSEPAVRAV